MSKNPEMIYTILHNLRVPRQDIIIEVIPPVTEEMIKLIAEEGAEFMRLCNAGAAHHAPDRNISYPNG